LFLVDCFVTCVKEFYAVFAKIKRGEDGGLLGKMGGGFSRVIGDVADGAVAGAKFVWTPFQFAWDATKGGRKPSARLRDLHCQPPPGSQQQGRRLTPLLLLARVPMAFDEGQKALVVDKLKNSLMKDVADGNFSEWNVVAYCQGSENSAEINEGFQWLNGAARKLGTGRGAKGGTLKGGSLLWGGQ
jgi:hypothetical protein